MNEGILTLFIIAFFGPIIIRFLINWLGYLDQKERKKHDISAG